MQGHHGRRPGRQTLTGNRAGNHDFDRVSRCQGPLIGRVSRRPSEPSPQDEGFSMTTSFSVTKSAPRVGFALAACLTLALVAGPVRAEDKVLAKVNGSEI